MTDEYEKYAEMLYKLIGRGFSAGVYTQTTDVEMEVNGLMTYDRKEMKVEPERIRKINQKLCNALVNSIRPQNTRSFPTGEAPFCFHLPAASSVR